MIERIGISEGMPSLKQRVIIAEMIGSYLYGCTMDITLPQCCICLRV